MAKEIKRPRGRPEVPYEERRSVLMQFRVTPDEAKRIEDESQKRGLKRSDWLRARVIG